MSGQRGREPSPHLQPVAYVRDAGDAQGEGVNRVAGGYVDALGADAVAEVLQRRGGGRLVVLADVREENVLARPWRRAMAWPMPPAPVMTRTSLVGM
jgi:hypothetical protein